MFRDHPAGVLLLRAIAAGAVIALIALYASTLQTHISGSFPEHGPGLILKNEYIKDVGEIQVALNVWGTIHHTGYPLYAIVGNLFTAPLRLLGVEPAAAASVYAAAWGATLLIALGLLIARLTGVWLLAVLGVVVAGLTRSVWIHNVVAEVYSMSGALTVLMLLVALWPADPGDVRLWRRRLLWLALLGGIGVAHHRAIAFIAPGLLLALWSYLRDHRDHWRPALPRAIGLCALGFLPYIYMPLRALQDARWVYGEPDTLRGLWMEFSGKEADRLVRLPANAAALWDNVTSTWDILVHEMTLPGLIAGLIGLALALTVAPQRRAARVIALSAAGPLVFAVFYHTAVLPQAIVMPVVLALVVGVVFTIDWLIDVAHTPAVIGMVGLAVWGGALGAWSHGYIRELVTEPSGLATIALMERIPREGTPAFMLPWGPRYAAAAYAELVTGEHDDIRVVDHKADFRAMIAEGYQLYTEPDTFYTYPPPWPTAFSAPSTWWPDHLGQVYLRSAAPGIVEILNTPQLIEPGTPSGTPIVNGIERRDAWLTCDETHIYLHVIWGADARPSSDPSIFVHLTGEEPAPDPPSADRRHPVYGLYPFAAWSPGQIVRDDYTLPRLPDKTQVRFGLYEQDASGQFVNYGALTLPVSACAPAQPAR